MKPFRKKSQQRMSDPSRHLTVVTHSACRPSEPSKPTKSALKKASRIARQERRQREKEEKARARAAAKGLAPQPSAQSDAQASPSDSPASSSFVVLEPESASHSASESVVKTVTPALDVAAEPVSQAKPIEGPVSSPRNGNGNGHHYTEAATVTTSSAPPQTPPTESKPIQTVKKPAVVEPVIKAVEKVPEVAREVVAKALPPQPADEETAKKRQNVLERVVWTFIMIGGFVGQFFFCTYDGFTDDTMKLFYSLGMPTWSCWSCCVRHWSIEK
jgi:phosphatidate cytidylyltransferase